MTTYRVSLWRRFLTSIAGFLGLIYILPFVLNFQGFTLQSLFYLTISIILLLMAILSWLTKITIEESGIIIPADGLYPKFYKIPWSDIKTIHRIEPWLAIVSARYGMVYGIEIEFVQKSSLRKVKLNIGAFSDREKLLREIYKYVGSKMSETPAEIRSKSERTFLGFWGVYLFIIAIILIAIFVTYSNLNWYKP